MDLKSQSNILLKWLEIPSSEREKILKGSKKLKSLNINADNLKSAFTSNKVDIKIIEKYCTKNVFSLLTNLIRQKKDLDNEECSACYLKECPLAKGKTKWISCDSCFLNYHYTCVNLKQRKLKSYWYCPDPQFED